MGGRRHQAKSSVLRAAATAAMGERDAAAAMVRTALDLAGACDARPLQWAAHLLLPNVGEIDDHAAIATALRAEMLDGLPEDLLRACGLAETKRS